MSSRPNTGGDDFNPVLEQHGAQLHGCDQALCRLRRNHPDLPGMLEQKPALRPVDGNTQSLTVARKARRLSGSPEMLEGIAAYCGHGSSGIPMVFCSWHRF
jgi:hypothetical protein